MYMDDIKVFEKWKRTGDPDKNNKNIKPGYRNGIGHGKIIVMAVGKTERVEGIEQPS